MTAVLAVLLAAFAASAAARADVVVAVPVPASGFKADVGRAIAGALSHEVTRLNRTGGLLGRKVRIATFDDGCDRARATETARTIVALRPVVVIGHPCGNAAVAAAPVYAGAKLLLLAPAVRDAALTAPRASPTIFRVAGRDDRQGAAAARLLAREYRDKRIAIVHDRTQLMRTLAGEVRDGLQERGIDAALSTTIVAGQKDYAALVSRLRSHAVDVVYFAGFPTEAARVVEQIRAARLPLAFIGPDVLATAEFGAAADETGDRASAIRLTRMAHFQARKADACPGRESAKDGDQRESDAALLACAAFEAWIHAATAAGSLDADVIGASLESATVDSVIGPLSFANGGDARVLSYDIVTWRGGSWRSAPAAVPAD